MHVCGVCVCVCVRCVCALCVCVCVCVRCVCVCVCVCDVQVVFAFLHDYSILNELQSTNITPMKAHIQGGVTVVYACTNSHSSVMLSRGHCH